MQCATEAEDAGTELARFFRDRAFSGKVETGFPLENATTQRI
jgi:hypothetical protein